MRITLILALLLTGCAGLQGSYVNADAKTYNVFKPRITVWVANDAAIDTQTKVDLSDLLYSWGVRVREGLASVASQ